MRPRSRCSCAVIIATALALPAAQTAHAVDIYYARAIGQEYLPESAPGQPQRNGERAQPALPALGAPAEEDPAPEEGMGLWSKVLIGTLVVAAIAALGNRGGGGSAGVGVGTGGVPAPDSGNSGPGGGSGGGSDGGGDSGSDGGSGGGGGIGIDLGLGAGSGTAGNRGNNRDRDDRGRRRGNGNGND